MTIPRGKKMPIEDTLSIIVFSLCLALAVVLGIGQIGCQRGGNVDGSIADTDTDTDTDTNTGEVLDTAFVDEICFDEPAYLEGCDVETSCCLEGTCLDLWDTGVGICAAPCDTNGDCGMSNSYGQTFCLGGFCVLPCGDPNVAVCPEGQGCFPALDAAICWPEGG